ncbi:acyl-CoA dehydrogenase [Sinorhizobium meliloti]|nr:acyl-CoA dehydrogenase [Sinorhizobium meliloti]RVK57066.1 acyl-CoA dehydrogenase [Sinorhizobium meliloti]
MAFQGEDYEAAYVPQEARKILRRWDERSTHHEVRQVRHY